MWWEQIADAWRRLWTLSGWVPVSELKVTVQAKPIYRRSNGQLCAKVTETTYEKVSCQGGFWQAESIAYRITNPQELVIPIPLDWCYQPAHHCRDMTLTA